MSEPANKRLLRLALGLILGLAASGCDISNVVSIPPLGTLEITTVTTGSNLDASGYELAVNGPSLNLTRAIEGNDSAIFSIVTGGSYRIELREVAGNCAVDANPQTVTVVIGSVSTATFNVACV